MAPYIYAQKKSKWTPLFNKKDIKAQKHKIEEKDKKDTLIPDQKIPYEEYYLMIRDKIYDMIRQENDLDIKGEVKVQFTLNRDGFITRGPIVLNKPDLALVRSAVKCVKKIVPFPRFPSSLDKEEAEFYIVVRYE